ncbi:MAG: hypothetical protein IPP74_14145 [Alphaproteobacteria bacterium]|nr:hypothetical protein [Alphaproteobacteria bacterium]
MTKYRPNGRNRAIIAPETEAVIHHFYPTLHLGCARYIKEGIETHLTKEPSVSSLLTYSYTVDATPVDEIASKVEGALTLNPGKHLFLLEAHYGKLVLEQLKPFLEKESNRFTVVWMGNFNKNWQFSSEAKQQVPMGGDMNIDMMCLTDYQSLSHRDKLRADVLNGENAACPTAGKLIGQNIARACVDKWYDLSQYLF